MKNLPIKKGLEKKLKQDKHPGVWKLKDQEMYVKLISKLKWSIVRINPSDYDNHKDALEDTIACAKVYKRFVDESLYPPDTQVVVCKDDEDNLTLMITMPELKIAGDINELASSKFITKREDIFERIGLDPYEYPCGDLSLEINWGYDKKTKKPYAHDLHIDFSTKQILEMAKELGYKK